MNSMIEKLIQSKKIMNRFLNGIGIYERFNKDGKLSELSKRESRKLSKSVYENKEP